MTIAIIVIICVLAWIAISGKKRRRQTLELEIYKLASDYTTLDKHVVLPHVYFEAALKFALEQGARLAPGQSKLYASEISYEKTINGIKYLVQFSKMPSGGTWLGLADLGEAGREFRKSIGKPSEADKRREKELEPDISEYVYKHSDDPRGAFANIYYDMAVSLYDDAPPLERLALAFAARSAAAGMYLQGLIDSAAYKNAAGALARAHSAQAEEISFREKAANIAIKFMRTYDGSLSKELIALITVMAEGESEKHERLEEKPYDITVLSLRAVMASARQADASQENENMREDGYMQNSTKGGASLPPVRLMIDTLGFDKAVEITAQTILQNFAEHGMGREHIRQFLREEADAARQGDLEARKLARELFSDPAEYIGAMTEDTPYPVDMQGGPQQMIVAAGFQFADNRELGMKFRCAVVRQIKREYDGNTI